MSGCSHFSGASKQRLAIVLVTPAAATRVPGQTVWFVDDSSIGGLNNGTSRANAFLDLQDALDVATNADEIRVGQGEYKPNRGTFDRTAAFELVDGVSLLGGYAGHGEPDTALRDRDLYITILTGDIFADDEPVNPFGGPMGDVDDDCSVTLDDYLFFEICLWLSGPGGHPVFQDCLDVFDFDDDDDVDMGDFARFGALFGH